MEIRNVARHVREARPYSKYTGFIRNLRTGVTKDRKIRMIRNEQGAGVKIVFAKPMEHLSVFQNDMLYSIFFLKRKPVDYARYHKCPAGREFFQNIKELFVLTVDPNPKIIETKVVG